MTDNIQTSNRLVGRHPRDKSSWADPEIVPFSDYHLIIHRLRNGSIIFTPFINSWPQRSICLSYIQLWIWCEIYRKWMWCWSVTPRCDKWWAFLELWSLEQDLKVIIFLKLWLEDGIINERFFSLILTWWLFKNRLSSEITILILSVNIIYFKLITNVLIHKSLSKQLGVFKLTIHQLIYKS